MEDSQGLPEAWADTNVLPFLSPDICRLLQAQLVTLGGERDSEEQPKGPFCLLPRWGRNSR